MKHRFVVYRHGKISPKNITIVTAETLDIVRTESELIEAIRRAVEKYVRTTPEGRAMYDYSQDDTNIGDLGDNVDDIVKCSEVILSLSFESIETADDWTYDTSLCPEINFTDEEKGSKA